jgi:Tol biopolymer transport system component
MNRTSKLILILAGTAIALTAAAAPTTERISQTTAGVGGNSSSSQPQLSANGNIVIFISSANNLDSYAPIITSPQVWSHNRTTNANSFLNVTGNESPPLSNPRGMNGSCTDPSYRGGPILYVNGSNNPPGAFVPCPDTNGFADVYRGTDAVSTINNNPCDTLGNGLSQAPSVSGNGLGFAFESNATNMVTGDTNGATDIFYKTFSSGAISRISVTGNILSGISQANGASNRPSVNSDGSAIAFSSVATNLVAGSGANRNIYVRATGGSPLFLQFTDLVSPGVGGAANGNSDNPSISDTGRYVAFESIANNLGPSDTNGLSDVYVYDRTNNTMELASLGSSGLQGNGGSTRPSISADGRFVAFLSASTNLVDDDTNGQTDVFVHDMVGGGTHRVSISTGGVEANATCANPIITVSGGEVIVGYDTTASNLVGGDSEGNRDVFVTTMPIPPTNDACAKALPITDGVWAFNNIGADNSLSLAFTCGSGSRRIYRDVWYRYTAPRTGKVRAHNNNRTTLDTIMAVHSAPCPTTAGGGVIACNDDIAGSANRQSAVSFNAVAGQQYLIRIGQYDVFTIEDGRTGSFVVSSCPADVATLGGALFPDGTLTADDVIAFLNAFFNGNLAVADIATLGGASGADGSLTADDVILFLGLFFNGCA